MKKVDGQCMCGAVKFTAEPESSNIGLCHCDMCRQWGGGLPYAGVRARVNLHASDTLAWWNSSAWGKRGFCNACGSSLFWCMQQEQTEVEHSSWVVSIGALQDSAGFAINDHIYIEEKPEFYDFTDQAPRRNGAEFMKSILKGTKE